MRGGLSTRAMAALVLGASLAASSAAAADKRGGLPRALDAIVDAPRFAHAWWGVEVRSLRPAVRLPVALVWRRERRLPPAARAFVDFVGRETRGLPAPSDPG